MHRSRRAEVSISTEDEAAVVVNKLSILLRAQIHKASSIEDPVPPPNHSHRVPPHANPDHHFLVPAVLRFGWRAFSQGLNLSKLYSCFVLELPGIFFEASAQMSLIQSLSTIAARLRVFVSRSSCRHSQRSDSCLISTRL